MRNGAMGHRYDQVSPALARRADAGRNGGGQPPRAGCTDGRGHAREAAYVEAVQAFYAGEDQTFRERLAAWAEEAARVDAAFPGRSRTPRLSTRWRN